MSVNTINWFKTGVIVAAIIAGALLIGLGKDYKVCVIKGACIEGIVFLYCCKQLYDYFSSPKAKANRFSTLNRQFPAKKLGGRLTKGGIQRSIRETPIVMTNSGAIVKDRNPYCDNYSSNL